MYLPCNEIIPKEFSLISYPYWFRLRRITKYNFEMQEIEIQENVRPINLIRFILPNDTYLIWMVKATMEYYSYLPTTVFTNCSSILKLKCGALTQNCICCVRIKIRLIFLRYFLNNATWHHSVEKRNNLDQMTRVSKLLLLWEKKLLTSYWLTHFRFQLTFEINVSDDLLIKVS